MNPSLLQALASCSSLVRQLQQAASTLPELQPADGSFTAALLECLERLQPCDEHAAAPASVSPARVLHALRQRIGDAVLPAGEEHDAVEAFEVILGVVELELQRAFAHSAKLQLEAQGSLAALLRPPAQEVAPALPAPPRLEKQQQQQQGQGPAWDGAGLLGGQEGNGHAGDAATPNRGMCSTSSSPLVATLAATSAQSLEGASLGAAGSGANELTSSLPCSSEPQTNGTHTACNGSCMGASSGPASMGRSGSMEAGTGSGTAEQQEQQPGSPKWPVDSRGSGSSEGAAEQQQKQQPGSSKQSANNSSGGQLDAAASSADCAGDCEGGGGPSFMYVDEVLSSWQAWARLSCQASPCQVVPGLPSQAGFLMISLGKTGMSAWCPSCCPAPLPCSALLHLPTASWFSGRCSCAGLTGI